LLEELACQVGSELGEDDGVIVFGPSGHKKCGNDSVGVQGQWLGRLGKVDNGQVDIMQKLDKSVPCCLCNAIVRFPDGRKKTSFDLAPIKPSYSVGIWKNVTRVLSTRFVLFTQSVAVRRKVLTRIGGFDESFSIMEYHDLALHLSLVGPWAYIKEPLVIYHADKPEGLSYRARKEKNQIQKVIVRMYFKILHDNRIECPKTRSRMERNLKNAQ
jgi:hypothetical protein